ncbi:MAG: stage II sporulation protein M [Clostridia bacterium]
MNRRGFRKRAYLSNKKVIIIILSSITLLAFLVGAFCCKYIGIDTADRIFNIFKTTAQNSEYIKTSTVLLLYYLIIFTIILVLGMSAIGIPFILCLCGYLSFGSGFAIGCLYQFYSYKGLLISSLAIAPTIIISFTLVFLFSSVAIDYSFKLFSFYSKGKLSKNELPKFNSLINKAIIFYTINIISILYETFISPLFINMIIK